MAELIHELIEDAARRSPAAAALCDGQLQLDYAALAAGVAASAAGLLGLGLARFERVAVFLDKREETVLALFGAAAAGCVLVPVNPLLKAQQVAHILRDSNARVLVTSCARLDALGEALGACPELRWVVLAGGGQAAQPGLQVCGWDQMLAAGAQGRPAHQVIETDIAALLYTSCSSGLPKGLVLSHHNLVAGARSSARYLGNGPHDRILALLPLCVDYGLSQLTTAFASGACAVLFNHLLMRDIVAAVERERITGLAAVPAVWVQLAQLDWSGARHLRYLTSSGAAMPRRTLDALRQALPHTRIHLMHGLDEAFRSTCLAPDQLARRPDSIGKAAPNAEVLVLDREGRRCRAGEPGELVHRGPTVALGYWNDPQQTAKRFRPLAPLAGLPHADTALWSGDTVRMDEEGYLYLIGRSDDLIQSAGYRVSPTEVEQVLYATGLVGEAVALGVAHPVLGQAIAVVATAKAGAAGDSGPLLAACRQHLPHYMQPALVELRAGPLPRGPNGQADRRLLAAELAHLFADLVL